MGVKFRTGFVFYKGFEVDFESCRKVFEEYFVVKICIVIR